MDTCVNEAHILLNCSAVDFRKTQIFIKKYSSSDFNDWSEKEGRRHSGRDPGPMAYTVELYMSIQDPDIAKGAN